MPSMARLLVCARLPEIRTLAKDEAIIVSTNRNPARITAPDIAPSVD